MTGLHLAALAAYQPALLSLAVLGLAVLVQAFLAGILGYAGGAETPGLSLRGNHGDLAFRTIRTYQNSVENHSAFLAALLLAIVAGVTPWLVNLLAALHVGTRLAYWAVYYRGMGKPGGGVRTAIYVAGLFANIALAVAALYALAF